MHQLGDALIQYAIEQCAGLTLKNGSITSQLWVK